MEFGKALLIYTMGIISGLSIVPAVVFTQGLRLKQAKEPAIKPAAPAAPAAAPAAAAPAELVTKPAGTLSMKDLADIWVHLDAPSKLPYGALENYEPGSGKYYGQAGQDKWVDNVFTGRKNLFVVESGALNGVSHSNSIFFETERQWDCLLVEANPYLWPEVRSKQRKCHFLTAGLSITKEKGDFPFKLAGPLGGFTEMMAKSHVKRADSEIKRNAIWMKGKKGDGEVIRVLLALDRKTIDYWSLDTEGSELAILQGSGLEHIELGVLTVEHNNEMPKRQQIKDFLQKHGIERVRAGGQDDFYASRSYFQKRGLPFPT